MQNKTVEFLKEAKGEFVSGAGIAEKLGITRTAVWKHIKKLRTLGYDIESREKSGYSLRGLTEKLLPAEILPGLDTKIIGTDENKIRHFESVDSTNGVAKSLASKYPDGTIIVAEEQTGGKGRLDRSFFSPNGKGIWFSLLLHPNFLPKDAPKATLTAAVAVARAMDKFNLKAQIKWPNDIMHDGRKIVGILTEMSGEISRINYLVIGMGINVNISREEFPPEIRDIAASLSEVAGKEISRIEFFRAVLEEFDKLYIEILKNGFDDVLKLWRKYNITLGKNIRVISAENGETFEGVAVDIDSDGALVVDTPEGRRTVYAGDVSIRTK